MTLVSDGSYGQRSEENDCSDGDGVKGETKVYLAVWPWPLAVVVVVCADRLCGWVSECG